MVKYLYKGQRFKGGTFTGYEDIDSKGIPYERMTEVRKGYQARSRERPEGRRRLRFTVFKVEHKRTSLRYNGVKYNPYKGKYLRAGKRRV